MSAYTGIGGLVRLILRRDRLYLTFWIIGLVALAVFFVPMLPDMVGDEASKQALVQTMENPAMVAILGPTFGGEATLGAMYAQFMLLWVALGYAVFNVMFVVRHTCADEERGRLELLGSLPLGRNATLLAVSMVAVAANILLAVLVAAVMPLFAVETIDLAGSAVYAISLSALGLCFAGVASVMAQLAASAKGALGLSLALLGLSYLLRAYGDMSENALSFISPLGLVLQSQAYVSNLAWPALVLVLEAIMLAAVALAVQSRRDSGAGILPERRGRTHASGLLRGEWGLAMRQVRGTVIAWLVVCFAFSASYGSIMGEMSSFIENNSMYQQLMGVTPGMTADEFTDPVVSMLMLIMTVIATIPVVSVVNHLAAEERRGRMEQLLSKASSRTYIFAGYVVIAVAVALLTQLANTLGFWTACAASLPEPMELGKVLGVCFNYLPGQLAFAGLAALLVGLVPRASAATWAYLAYCFLAFYLGKMVDFPEAAVKLSPFGLLPAYPVEDADPAVIVSLIAIFAVLALAGALAYRRRNMR